MSDKTASEARRIQLEQLNAAKRRRLQGVVQLLGTSPPEAQLDFLRQLMSQPEQAKQFMEDPAEYAASHGVVLDPELVRRIVDTAVFGEPISEQMANQLGPRAVDALVSLQGDGRVAALPIAVATAVAVAGAAVALVTNAAQAKVSDLLSIGRPDRAAGALTIASSAAVLIYAVTMTSYPGVLAARRGRAEQ